MNIWLILPLDHPVGAVLDTWWTFFSRTQFLLTLSHSPEIRTCLSPKLGTGYVLWGKMMWKNYKDLKYQKALPNNLQTCPAFTTMAIPAKTPLSKINVLIMTSQRLLSRISILVLILKNYHSAFFRPNLLKAALLQAFVLGPSKRKSTDKAQNPYLKPTIL